VFPGVGASDTWAAKIVRILLRTERPQETENMFSWGARLAPRCLALGLRPDAVPTPRAGSVRHALPIRISRHFNDSPHPRHPPPCGPTPLEHITSIEKRRRHQGKVAKGEERDATPDLLLKHPNETFTTYV
jgi:hypothetical protein